MVSRLRYCNHIIFVWSRNSDVFFSYVSSARFVPGEVNVDAICVMFPSSAYSLLSSLLLFTALVVSGLVLV